MVSKTLSWLVAFRRTPLKNDGVKVSWDDFSIPNMMGKSFKIPWFQSPPISWLELRAALRLARPASFGSSISAISTVRWGASFFPDAEHRNKKAREPNKLHVEVFLKKTCHDLSMEIWRITISTVETWCVDLSSHLRLALLHRQGMEAGTCTECTVTTLQGGRPPVIRCYKLVYGHHEKIYAVNNP